MTGPLKVHGGKHYLASWIVSLMPRHMCYCEPFFGGGRVLFNRDPCDRRLWWDGKASDGRQPDGVVAGINDANATLMNFYTVLRDPEQFPRFRQRLERTLFSEAEWEHARQLLKGDSGDAVERAAAFFVLNRQSRQGLMK